MIQVLAYNVVILSVPLSWNRLTVVKPVEVSCRRGCVVVTWWQCRTSSWQNDWLCRLNWQVK